MTVPETVQRIFYLNLWKLSTESKMSSSRHLGKPSGRWSLWPPPAWLVPHLVHRNLHGQVQAAQARPSRRDLESVWMARQAWPSQPWRNGLPPGLSSPINVTFPSLSPQIASLHFIFVLNQAVLRCGGLGLLADGCSCPGCFRLAPGSFWTGSWRATGLRFPASSRSAFCPWLDSSCFTSQQKGPLGLPMPTQKGRWRCDVPLLKGWVWRHRKQEGGSGKAGGGTWLLPRITDCSTSASWHSVMEVSGILFLLIIIAQKGMGEWACLAVEAVVLNSTFCF